MPVILRVVPLDDQWVEIPANAEPAGPVGEEGLTPSDLAWREGWVEAFLAENATAVAACLGYDKPSAVLRQVGDMDLAFVDDPSRTVCVLEVKTPGGDHATEAVCQLARNLERAERALRLTYPGHSIRPIACGCWSLGQIERARDTNAWQYLEKQSKKPTFALYSGARSADGTEYFLIGEGTPPLSKKARRQRNELFAGLQRQAAIVQEKLPTGLRVAAYQVGGRPILRFTAHSGLRDEYLRARPGVSHSGAIAAFFHVEENFRGRSDLFVRSLLGQRLELFLQAKHHESGFSLLNATLLSIQSLVAGKSSALAGTPQESSS